MPPSIFFSRRQRYHQLSGSGVTVLFSSPHQSRNSDVQYEYRPDSDFYYLTGFDEPEAVAVLNPEGEKKLVMFVRPRDPAKEVWDGFRAGVEGARERFGADEAFPIEMLPEELPKLLEGSRVVHHRVGANAADDARLMEAVGRVRAKRTVHVWPNTFVDPSDALAEMRLAKGPEDLELLRRACEISCEGHREAMRAAKPGRFEYEVEAVVEFTFRRRGAAGWGYPTICGTGPNTCILHYVENTRQMQAGELMLVDAGAEYGLYTGDVTRTFPVSGRFSAEQRLVYSLCLAAQKAGLEKALPGNAFASVHEAALEVLVRGLLELGLVPGPYEHAIEKELYKPFYMHKTSHWLGMDVHDAGRYRDDAGESRKLEPGMVLTVEPGIYIAAHSPGVDSRWWNIGVRIEDDVLITPGGLEVLTAGAPKEVEEVERMCQEESRFLD